MGRWRLSGFTDGLEKEQLKEELEGKNWTTEEIRELIFKKFDVRYTLKHVRTILKKFGMNHAKPYPHVKSTF